MDELINLFLDWLDEEDDNRLQPTNHNNRKVNTMKKCNPGEAVTLRQKIVAEEKALRIADSEFESASETLRLTKEKFDKAEEALKKADPKSKDWNDVAKARNDAAHEVDLMFEEWGRVADARSRAAFRLNTTKRLAKEKFAI